MAELVAGAGKPLNREEVDGLIQRFLPHAEAAEKLRVRIAKGRAAIAAADPTTMDIEDANRRLAELEEEERIEGWGELVLLGLALGHGAAGLLSEAQEKTSWRPPAGSFVRVKLPGLLDLTVDMVDYGAVSKAAANG